MARACYRLAAAAVFSTATRVTDVWEAVDTARKAHIAVVFVYEDAIEDRVGAHLALLVAPQRYPGSVRGARRITSRASACVKCVEAAPVG